MASDGGNEEEQALALAELLRARDRSALERFRARVNGHGGALDLGRLERARAVLAAVSRALGGDEADWQTVEQLWHALPSETRVALAQTQQEEPAEVPTVPPSAPATVAAPPAVLPPQRVEQAPPALGDDDEPATTAEPQLSADAHDGDEETSDIAPPPDSATKLNRPPDYEQPPPASQRTAASPGVFPAPRVELTLEQYASLCAECAFSPNRLAETRARYYLPDEEAHRLLDRSWHDRFGGDPALRDHWEQLFHYYRGWLEQQQPR